MTITSVNLVWTGDTFDDDSDGGRGYQSLYRVISDDPLESIQAVRLAVPGPRAPYPTDPRAYVRSRSGRRVDESRLVWEVTVDYAFEVNEPPNSPLDEPVKYRWTAGQYTRAVVKDRDGDAIVNSAGDYFDPPPEIEDVRWSVNVQVNVDVVPANILMLQGAVNSGGYTVDGISVDAEKSRIVGLDISEVQERDEIKFRTITMVIEFREEGFSLQQLDQGYRRKNEDDELVDIMIEDDSGSLNRVSAPVLLDGEGKPLEDPSPETAVYMTYEVFKLVDFSSLPGLNV